MHLGRFVGHNGAVCALDMKGHVMITGSRDRLIKVSNYIVIQTDVIMCLMLDLFIL